MDNEANPDKLQQAIAWHQQGQLQQAAMAYVEILDADPGHFDALHLLGVYALQTDDLEAARDLIGRAIAVNPRASMPHANLGTVLQRLGQVDAALQSYKRALELDPANITALSNYGSALLKMRRYVEALPLFERALQLSPDYADALNNLGNALLELHRHHEALVCLGRALQIQPGFMEALFNQGNALQLLNRTDEALHSYAQALALNPQHVEANFNEAICRLLNGDLQGGWPQYEWRWRKPGVSAPPSDAPLWLGQTPLQGRSILVHAEQGFGDTIHMCRYVSMLAQRGARVVLRVQPALKPLLAALPGAQQVLADGEPLPANDLRCPLLSLPLAFNTALDTIPAGAPYVQADPQRIAAWQERLGAKTRPRIGLAWAGSSAHANDAFRSIGLLQLREVLTPQMEFVSLQRDLRAVDRIVLALDAGMREFAGQQTDFAETAALIAHMDLVISVDTSIAHLAAAMGKPTWILLPFAPDWRWMLNRDDSPWYPTVRLFRQTKAGDWSDVLAAVVRELAADDVF